MASSKCNSIINTRLNCSARSQVQLTNSILMKQEERERECACVGAYVHTHTCVFACVFHKELDKPRSSTGWNTKVEHCLTRQKLPYRRAQNSTAITTPYKQTRTNQKTARNWTRNEIIWNKVHEQYDNLNKKDEIGRFCLTFRLAASSFSRCGFTLWRSRKVKH